ncbi:D-alanine--D-alanine ligase [Hyella patelloides LEGE 07179]|uniref:D-alanine--D-alanine ligase n=1 Tax=Hyella patelloides LEGE 07179 TaxID=945734 RepID=A0A563VSP3_9CYAN|nr:D-alanine--D-alanine ligase [Hyella patelloides]VEP14431.1 D-alanine--D-alanine ligase [Hyella patelloides LEGE 07179]
MTTFSPINSKKIESQFDSNKLSVLHLVGSAVSDFYYKLSVLYAQEVVQPAGVKNNYAVMSPDGLWQLGSSLDNLGNKISLQEMINQLPQIDVVVPHMFCVPGMTSYRAFFEDILGIPVVGAKSDCNALATNKSHTRNIVSAAGVRVAKAQQLKRGETLTMQPPFVVKPNSEDNSMGVTLVTKEAEIAPALEAGFKYDKILLIEEYIPGRELRVGAIEKDGELCVLPAIEYLLTENNPIRTKDDKLGTQDDGMLTRQPVDIACPAKVSPELAQKLADAVKKAHNTLGYRDYSLYDFRIHAETQEPYMLESCSFWSFIEASVLSRMVTADGQKLEDVALKLWTNAAKRTRVACGSLFKYVDS